MSNNVTNDEINTYITRLKQRLQLNPRNTKLRNSIDRLTLMRKQLQLVRQEVKRQRNAGIPIPASQTPEQKKKINNFFSQKARNEVALNKTIKSLNQNIRTARVPQQAKTLKNIRQGIQNSRTTTTTTVPVSNVTGFPMPIPKMSPYPIRIGGKTRRSKKRGTRRH